MFENDAYTVIVVPDTQAPKWDYEAVRTLIHFMGVSKPDEIVHVGDALDFEGPARWTKDTRAEYEGNVEEEATDFARKFLGPVHAVLPSIDKSVIEGNHDLRPRQYLEKYAPALLSKSKHYHFENLCNFKKHGWKKAPDFYEVRPGTVITHGHLGRIGLRQVAGMTALGAAQRWNKSVVMGHTHRAAAIPATTGVGAAKTIWGVEVGHLMDEDQAEYLKGTPGNWQKAFAILHFDEEDNLNPEIVYYNGTSFQYNGVTYSPPEIPQPARDAQGRFKRAA